MSHIILCVDDDKTVLNALRTLLTNTLPEGCRVEVAESGPECIEVCQALEAEGLTPLMVISDFIMPQMRGDELLVRLHARYPSMIKVMLTGQADFAGVRRVINEASLYRFIDKPFKNADMVLTVKTAIEFKQTECDLRDEITHLKSRITELESQT